MFHYKIRTSMSAFIEDKMIRVDIRSIFKRHFFFIRNIEPKNVKTRSIDPYEEEMAFEDASTCEE